MTDLAELPLPFPLLVAHAPRKDREWHRLCWAIDGRMARIAMGAKERAIAAIRLAWWEEALTKGDGESRGEPMLERWRAALPGENEKAAIGAVAGAWRLLLDPEPMGEADWRGFGKGRGALFALIARMDPDPRSARAAELWSLWDAAGRDSNRQRAEGAFAAAIECVQEGDIAIRIKPKPLALATAMALDDVRSRIMPDGRFTPRQYLRLLGRSFMV